MKIRAFQNGDQFIQSRTDADKAEKKALVGGCIKVRI